MAQLLRHEHVVLDKILAVFKVNLGSTFPRFLKKDLILTMTVSAFFGDNLICFCFFQFAVTNYVVITNKSCLSKIKDEDLSSCEYPQRTFLRRNKQKYFLI